MKIVKSHMVTVSQKSTRQNLFPRTKCSEILIPWPCSCDIFCDTNDVCVTLATAFSKPTHEQAFKYMMPKMPKEANWMILKVTE